MLKYSVAYYSEHEGSLKHEIVEANCEFDAAAQVVENLDSDNYEAIIGGDIPELILSVLEV